MTSPEREPCYAGKLIDSWLSEHGHTLDWLITQINQRRAAAGIVKGAIARSNLWRWRMGKQRPDVDHAAFLEDITEGFVPSRAWAIGAEARAVEAEAAALPREPVAAAEVLADDAATHAEIAETAAEEGRPEDEALYLRTSDALAESSRLLAGKASPHTSGTFPAVGGR